MAEEESIKTVNNKHKNLKFGVFPSEELANFEANLRKEFYIGKLEKLLKKKNKGS